MNLSVLIATVPQRKSLLSRMLHSLMQPGLNSQYEILVHQGNRPHGEKVNRMVEHAYGSHVVIIDDDDWVAANYVESVVPHDEDFVGYRIVVMAEGMYDQTVVHDATYDGFTGPLRGVSQKCPIVREAALQVPYPDDYYQDGVWSAEIQQLIGTHAYVDQDLYFYDYWNQDRYRHVGWFPYDKTAIRWL